MAVIEPWGSLQPILFLLPPRLVRSRQVHVHADEGLAVGEADPELVLVQERNGDGSARAAHQPSPALEQLAHWPALNLHDHVVDAQHALVSCHALIHSPASHDLLHPDLLLRRIEPKVCRQHQPDPCWDIPNVVSDLCDLTVLCFLRLAVLETHLRAKRCTRSLRMSSSAMRADDPGSLPPAKIAVLLLVERQRFHCHSVFQRRRDEAGGEQGLGRQQDELAPPPLLHALPPVHPVARQLSPPGILYLLRALVLRPQRLDAPGRDELESRIVRDRGVEVGPVQQVPALHPQEVLSSGDQRPVLVLPLPARRVHLVVQPLP
eukprot:763615-Hanusia_phi.AAC.5